jgi:renal tumor antigen
VEERAVARLREIDWRSNSTIDWSRANCKKGRMASGPSRPNRWDDLKQEHPEYFLNSNSIILGEEIAEGTFAKVYVSVLQSLRGKTRVAAKQFKANVVSVAGSELIRELKAMLRIEPHPNIVNVIGVIADPGSQIGFCLVLEYAQFGTLYDFLKSPQSISKLLPLLIDICEGMKALHTNNLVHSDIKSPNVLIFDAGDGALVAKVSDHN